ncbi:MAG: hypothetical protein O7I42_04855 [Alphaproteobacteria bacterium]|nr:hypothetical protein [Alphaproteobacteria bacterium]
MTTIEKRSLLGTPHADETSIMCYQIPGANTKDGRPILGGIDIGPQDAAFVAQIYPIPEKSTDLQLVRSRLPPPPTLAKAALISVG